MVIELKVPSAPTWGSLLDESNVFLSYVINFLYVGIYWNNHHHVLTLIKRINCTVMWFNLLFLGCLSLFPFSIAWLNKATPVPACVPTAFYGITLLLTTLSWRCLCIGLIRVNGGSVSELQKALGSDWKTKVAIWAHVASIGMAFRWPGVSCGLYAAVAAVLCFPFCRIEEKDDRD